MWNSVEIIIGNGTTSREIREKLYFFKKEIITFEEKNTTYRAKARYFELFPISGLKFLMPREVFILNKNLDAISALIILEDYCKTKFTLNQNTDFKTWLKSWTYMHSLCLAHNLFSIRISIRHPQLMLFPKVDLPLINLYEKTI